MTKILPSGDGADQIGSSILNGDDADLRFDVIANDVRVEGNLTVLGDTTTVSTTNTVIKDALIELNNGESANSNDLGLILERGSTGDNAAIIWDESHDRFVVGTTTATGTFSGDLSITTGTLVANLDSESTLTSVKVATEFQDANGAELIAVSATSSAANHFKVSNAAAGNNPTLEAEGSDSNVGVDVQLKGSGSLDVKSSAATAAQVRLFEATNDGSHYVGLQASDLLESYTLKLPRELPSQSGLSLVSSDDGTCSWNAVSSEGLGAEAVKFNNIQDLSSMTVIGRTATGSGVSSEVSILDQDDLSSDSATALATQQSIKSYVDSHTTALGSAVSGTLALSNGGTGATTAAAARTALGVDAAGTDNSTNVTLATVTDNYLSISGQEVTAGTVPVSLGGTGATTASAARAALEVDVAGTDNSTNVTLANTNYLSISGQEITGGTVPLSSGGTGATTAAAARTALGVDAAGTDNSTNVTLATVTDNYLSISGQEVTAGTVPVSLGGTGATTAAAARTALDVDVAGTDNSTDVTLATVTGNYLSISGQELTAGTVPVSLGGTGATTAAAARTALDVDVAGTDNSTDVSLATVTGNYLSISGQEITAGTVPVSLGGTGATTAAGARTALGVDAAGTDNSTNVTLANTNYLSISGQEITGGTVPLSSGGTGATTAAAARTALGVDEAGTDNSTNVTLATVTGNYLSLSGQEITAGTVPVSLGGTGATTAAAARTALDVDVAGTDNSTNVTLANTNYLSISGQEITGGTVPVSSGGTGATTAAGALTNLGLTATAAEINRLDISSEGTTEASSVVTTDSNNDISHTGVVTLTHDSGTNALVITTGDFTMNSGDLTVAGSAQVTNAMTVNNKLTLGSSIATVGAPNVRFEDSLIELNYDSDDIGSNRDLGFFGHQSGTGASEKFEGFVFDGSDSVWKLGNTTTEPNLNNTFTVSTPSSLELETIIIKKSAPTSSDGVSGDKAGMIAYDSSYFYVCFQDFVAEGTACWKRVALSSTSW